MSKKPRNKRYRPKYVTSDPLHTFFGGMSGVHAEHLVDLKLKNHMAMACMVRGDGDKSTWDRLVGSINVANVMTDMGIGAEFSPVLLAARDALLEVGVRSVTTGRFVFRGDELKTMQEAMACHDTQLDNVRSIDVDRAAAEVTRRLSIRENGNSVNKELAARAAMRAAA